ncbi:MAG TPA: hypothetical protein VK250_10170 [Nitrososphaeraceae archaeon]|nr:hypothetical protein [Nitrososphaeraceae archaeon]
MIEDISTTKDVVTEEQDNNCDVCNNEIKTAEYLTVTSTKAKMIPGDIKQDIDNDDAGKCYNVCLDCIEKIKDLLTYNYGFDGRLIQFFKELIERKDKK